MNARDIAAGIVTSLALLAAAMVVVGLVVAQARATGERPYAPVAQRDYRAAAPSGR